jgi:lysophospholipid hydrolase
MHQIELDNDIVLYQADWQLSAWNRLCIINCDEILLVANTLDNYEMESMEKWLHTQSKLIPKTLLMLYTNPSPDLKPLGTRNWIEAREGAVDRHVHARLHSNNQMHDTINYRSDFNRLARILTNTAVGVVLGGGGARGLSHLGVLQALEERNIPVDMVGGTSIGSFVGGLYAYENSISTVNPIAETWALKMNSYWCVSTIFFPF